MDVSPPKLLWIACISALFALGMYNFQTMFESNSCEMTYMYQSPLYMKIILSNDITKRFPRYGLFMYGEGSAKPVAKGIPVFFIPGNAGSHKQVRSLASVALKKVRDKPSPFHFTYFVADFNEEFSALSGQILNRQINFVAACMKQIFAMYTGQPSPPTSIVLVGHSMGGFVARALFTLPAFDPNSVNLIVTQATPHQVAVITLDVSMATIYARVSAFWQDHGNSTLRHVTVFSTGGGWRDLLVRTDITSLDGIVSSDRQISTSTMSVPNAWVSADHLCHVWCKQIVMATTRALFDCVDKTTKQLSADPLRRMKVFRHHFVRNAGHKRYKSSQFTVDMKLDPQVKREMRRRQSWSFHRDALKQTRYSLVDVSHSSDKAFVAITSVNSDAWIGGCLPGKNTSTCDRAENLAGRAAALPPLYSEKKVVHLSAQHMQKYTNLIAVLPRSRSKVALTAELYDVGDRHVSHRLPDLLQFLRTLPGAVFGRQAVLNATQANAVFYNVSLAGLEMPLQAYTAHLRRLQCTAAETTHTVLMKLYIPWTKQETYKQISAGHDGDMSLKLQAGKVKRSSHNAQLHLYLDPACRYQLTVSIAWLELFGQFIRFYAVCLPAYLLIQVLMVFSYQLKMMAKSDIAPGFLKSQQTWAQPWRVVGAALILKVILSYPDDGNLASALGLPPDDSVTMMRLRTWYSALPIMLYLLGYALAAIFTTVLQVTIAVVGSLALLASRWCCRSTSCQKMSRYLQFCLQLMAVVVAMAVSETAGLCIVFFLQSVRVLGRYIQMRRARDKDKSFATTLYNTNVTVLQLLLAALTLNSATLITWVKELSSRPASDWLTGLSSSVTDQSWSSDLVLIISAVTLQIADFPQTSSSAAYAAASHVLLFASVISILFATVSVFRLGPLVAASLLTVAVPTAVARRSPHS